MYNKPEVEIIEMLTEGVIASSVDFEEETTGGVARSKKTFWDNGEK